MDLVGKKVDVYWNLHKKVWSVRCCKTRLVVHHAKTVVLKDCQLKVSEKGRQRVIREKRKNVHAFVRGTVAEVDPGWDPRFGFGNAENLRYNPYTGPTFTIGGKEAHTTGAVFLATQGTRPCAVARC